MRPNLRPSRHILLPFLAVLVVSTIHAAAQATHPAFEVATVKSAPPDADPNTGYWSFPGKGRFKAYHLSLARLIQLAWDIDLSQIASKPGWLEINLYDIEATPEDGIKLTNEELRPRLQDLLRLRFHLVAHMESRPITGFALIVAKGGPHLTPTKGDRFPGYRINVSSGKMRGANWTMPQLAKYLTPAAGFPVVDQTGITGSYDIDFTYDPNPDSNSGQPTLSAALQQSTGLALRQQKVTVDTLVIDSVDKVPTEN